MKYEGEKMAYLSISLEREGRGAGGEISQRGIQVLFYHHNVVDTKKTIPTFQAIPLITFKNIYLKRSENINTPSFLFSHINKMVKYLLTHSQRHRLHNNRQNVRFLRAHARSRYHSARALLWQMAIHNKKKRIYRKNYDSNNFF